MSKTKIVCTLGPSSSSPLILKRLLRAGMDLARLNFSHGTHEEHGERISALRDLSEKEGRPLGIIQDLAGTKIRIGRIGGDGVLLRAGSPFVLTTREVEGGAEKATVRYPSLPKVVEKGDILLLADGTIQLEVRETGRREVRCKVLVGGRLTSFKGINLPEASMKIRPLTEKDKRDLEFGIERGVDFVALSFVRKGRDIRTVKRRIRRLGGDAPVIAKIEKPQALRELQGILREADGFMVARGDLGVETPLERVPLLQKRIISGANELAKPVITATQMLLSMVESPKPTRAEVADVAHAIYDGTDALMLSEETAVGRYPVKAVETMRRIAEETEKDLPSLQEGVAGSTRSSVPHAISHAAFLLAEELKARVIIAPTRSGETARLIARYRPRQPILALSSNQATIRRLTLVWGVFPAPIPETKEINALLQRGEEVAKRMGLAGRGDLVVVTAGLPSRRTGAPNLLRVKVLE
jgi:pyruvate kinase